jgi:hypothetical protein
MKNTYKIILLVYVAPLISGNNGKYEQRAYIMKFTHEELAEYCNNNHVCDFQLINKPVETTNEQPKDIIEKAKDIIDDLVAGWGMCPDIEIEKEHILQHLSENL